MHRAVRFVCSSLSFVTENVFLSIGRHNGSDIIDGAKRRPLRAVVGGMSVNDRWISSDSLIHRQPSLLVLYLLFGASDNLGQNQVLEFLDA